MSASINGVDLDNISALLNGIRENKDMAKVTFKAKSQWQNGTKAEVTISEMHSNGKNISSPDRVFKLMVDEPEVLGGTDKFPNPVEYLAAALCGCLTAGIATNAALFNTELEKIDIDVDVNFDVQGVLGLDRSKPNGPIDLV